VNDDKAMGMMEATMEEYMKVWRRRRRSSSRRRSSRRRMKVIIESA